jgi:FtsH-binding integral membrane protein
MTFLNEKDRQSSPLKWNLLALFTIGEAISVSFISSFYKTKSIIHAMLATGFSTAGITGYMLANKNPKYDLTQWGAGLSS